MFFIATTDAEGHPQCSYKGGDPGFVRVLDEQTIAFPVYDGNGMYLTAGNLTTPAKVGLLFIDFERRKRLRLNGLASVDDSDPLLAEYPEAQLVVRVKATEVFPNCPRYIHEYRLVARSRFVPKAEARPRCRSGSRANGRTTFSPRAIRRPIRRARSSRRAELSVGRVRVTGVVGGRLGDCGGARTVYSWERIARMSWPA